MHEVRGALGEGWGLPELGDKVQEWNAGPDAAVGEVLFQKENPFRNTLRRSGADHDARGSLSSECHDGIAAAIEADTIHGFDCMTGTG